MFKSIYYTSVLFLLTVTPSFAGSGLYLGVDAISHELDTHVEVNQTFSMPPPEPNNNSNAVKKDFTDVGLRIGYKYKRRLNDNFFISPEFIFSELDNDYIYGTNLKIGTEIKNFSIFGVAGISRIEQFEKNQATYGIGLAYKLSSIISINLEWQKTDTIREETIDTRAFGAQILTTETDTQRDISSIKLGITIYFHE